MRFELITEENLDDYTDNGEFPNFIHYPVKKLREDFYDKYSEIVKHDIDEKGHFDILKRSPLFICKK